uniref:Uncharacterized protein n=1 Tax=Serinus canaria TaxID=9135 RepID=A0A8C9KX95_SERCA
MDLAYVCEWEKKPKSNHCPSIPLVCAWSCRNLIAFTTDLRNEEEKDLTHMVHIIDTEHPWDVYSVNSGHTEVITCLEWDQSGGLGSLSLSPLPLSQCPCPAVHIPKRWGAIPGGVLAIPPVLMQCHC